MADPPHIDHHLNPRASLRLSPYIDPATGARRNKSFTLRSSQSHNVLPPNSYSDDTTPLLASSGDQHQNPSSSRPNTIAGSLKEHATNTKNFLFSDTGKGIFKCALAYLLGSLATFVPVISSLLGRQDSKHMVATITVYFHPARSLGSMLDALLLATTAFIYTALISLLSMTVAVFFADAVHLAVLGHIVVLVVFIGGGLGFIGWVKLKLNDPLVNIACSLASLGLITVLTKEGAVQAGDYSFEKISQILRMLIAGVLSTMLVSFIVFPISARAKLRQSLIDVTDCLSDMLALTTSSFLSGDQAELEDKIFIDISERHKKISASMPKGLKESKYEHYLLGTERQAAAEDKLAHCIQRISQSIGGLRSAARMQFIITNQQPPTSSWTHTPPLGSLVQSPFDSYLDRKPSTTHTNITDFFGPLSPDLIKGGDRSQQTPPKFRTPVQIFDIFIENLGPAMRSLAFTLKEILDDFPFDKPRDYAALTNPKFKVSLDRALKLYKTTRKASLDIVYEQKIMDISRPIPVQADWEEAAACCGYFSFSLVEVAESIKDYLLILDEFQLEVDEKPNGRSWSWLKFWSSTDASHGLDGVDPDFAKVLERADALDLQVGQPPTTLTELHSKPTWPGRSQFKQWLFQRLYTVMSFIRREDVKFAIKVGLGAMLYAAASFIPASRPTYSHWRGEWGLVSYMLVCSMTIGASNTTGYSRVLGTCLGAGLAIAAWEICQGNPFAMAFFGFCMAYWTAYIIVGQGKGPMGRFIMLTYNLSALYAYSLTALDDDDDGDEEDEGNNPFIFAIATHRVVAVLSGCLWGLIITRVVWPQSARQKLKDGLSLLWLRMGLIWKRDPLATLTEGMHPDGYMNLREEYYLQRYLASLQALTEASKSEFELRRPFPHATYARILNETKDMLDAFHAMNEVILKDLTASPGEDALLKATAKERAQLCGRISHLFSVLASSMKLEYAIPSDALPNIEHTRDRLLAKIFAYRRHDAEEQRTSDEDYSLLYTYALVTGQLSVGIDKVVGDVEELFGVLDEEALRLQ
ncbi:hypothetical protein B0A52_06964 [Exophiala mesophila]|uniref:Integral membrane bound transporter domain-containing protein n=1 Tax=Exophiala mesophila TaxID=212818 RepID=A0A438N0V9_EXOME|nr:hypothetical protein B0A52_06964 [Exophiala mesophila]